MKQALRCRPSNQLLKAASVRVIVKIAIYAVPPGVGKTLTCQGMASLAGNVNVFKITPAEICQSYFGEGEKVIKRTFEAARKALPSMLVIDEIDSVGQ